MSLSLVLQASSDLPLFRNSLKRPSGARACPFRRGRCVPYPGGGRCASLFARDLDSLRSEAANSDGLIHTAFIHDLLKYAAGADADGRAIETLGNAMA